VYAFKPTHEGKDQDLHAPSKGFPTVKIERKCLVCGIVIVIPETVKPLCKRPECLEIRKNRKAVHQAEESRLNYTPSSDPSEQIERLGRDTVAVETLNGLKTVEASDSFDLTESKKLAIPSAVTERPKRSVTLEQATALPAIGPKAAPYGYDSNDRPIRPPKSDFDRHYDLLRKFSARCSRHPDQPQDCFTCKNEIAQETARRKALDNTETTSRSVIPPSKQPEDAIDSQEVKQQKAIEEAKQFFGLNKRPAAEIRFVRPDQSLIAGAPWWASSEEKKKHGFALRKRESAPTSTSARTQTPVVREGLSFRQILGITPAQISNWLDIPAVLYGNLGILSIDTFEAEKNQEIENEENKIKSSEKELLEVEERRSVGSVGGRTIARIKRHHRRSIRESRATITQIKRRKFKPSQTNDRVEVPEPGGGQVRIYEGRRVEKELISQYRKRIRESSYDADQWRIFENGVIRLACQTVLSLLSSVEAEYPEINGSGESNERQSNEGAAEENKLVYKTGGAPYGRIRSRGYRFKPGGTGKLAGFVERSISSFDEILDARRTEKGQGSGELDGGLEGSIDELESDDFLA
jgi:hypothetical protein